MPTQQPTLEPATLTIHEARAATTQAILRDWVDSSLVLAEDWAALSAPKQDELARCPNLSALRAKLVDYGLLTKYQAERIGTGKTFGLILGNYRVLDHLGDGGMGVVYRAEHLRMRRPVAIKVLSISPGQNPLGVSRFLAEIRASAQLQHPHIVTALDCGEVAGPDPNAPVLYYFVMEYVPGQDLQEYVEEHGPLPPAKACDLVFQIANALDEAHKRHLVHRDIKPSNVRLTPEGQIKLLDFGLALQFRNRLTEPGTLLGTVDYLAPEQAQDASSVDIRADIYGLGGVLYWCLTGERPFPQQGGVAQVLVARLTQPPPCVRHRKPDIPAELDAIVARMMAVHADDRYPDPRAVMRALHAFLQSSSLDASPGTSTATALEAARSPSYRALAERPEGFSQVQRILIVDDEPHLRCICRYTLQSEELHCDEAANGVLALQATHARRYDLVLLDIDMPEMKGTEVLRRLRQTPPCSHLKIIMFSGRASADEMAEMLLAGADDYLTKPFSNIQLQARVKAALRLKEAQDRSDLLNRQLLAAHSQQGQTLTARESDLVHTRNALVLALSKLVEYRKTGTTGHLLRMQRYTRYLAEEAAALRDLGEAINPDFIQAVERCSPLHDIGTIALPDPILEKKGKLEPEERLILESHTTIGADILQEIAKEHPTALAFLQVAIDIARHHHERHDGTGYPDRLAGDAIPLAARLVAVADVYDSLRTGRTHRVGLSHTGALQAMTEDFGTQFDPVLCQVFQRCAPRFERAFRELPA